MAYQWQQQDSANEWINDQGIKNGGTVLVGNQTQYTQDSSKANNFNKFMGLHFQPKRGFAGAHADAFVRPELRDQAQQSIPLLTNRCHHPGM